MQRFWPVDFGVPFGNAGHSKSSELIISRPRVRRLFLNLGPRERQILPFHPAEQTIADQFWDLLDRHAKHFGSLAMSHRIRVRRLLRSHRMQNLVRRVGVGLHPHVDQPKSRVIISLSAEHKIPPSLDASLLDLETRQIVTEKRVGFDHAEPPVGLVPPVVIFLQLNSDSRHRSCGWSQSSRINPTDVKTWRFDVGDKGFLGFPTVDPFPPRNDKAGIFGRMVLGRR